MVVLSAVDSRPEPIGCTSANASRKSFHGTTVLEHHPPRICQKSLLLIIPNSFQENQDEPVFQVTDTHNAITSFLRSPVLIALTH